jgi:gas vesicle protein
MKTNDWKKAVRDAGRQAGRSAEEMSGRRRPGPGRFLAIGAIGAAIGAAIAFLFDPQRGRARRAQLVDRSAATLRDVGHQAEHGARRVASTVQGKIAAVGANGSGEPMPNDASLANKVESELFRDPDIPKGAINVNVEQGVVVLRGEVPDAELGERLEHEARAIPGVWEVENLLHLPGEPAPTQR